MQYKLLSLSKFLIGGHWRVPKIEPFLCQEVKVSHPSQSDVIIVDSRSRNQGVIFEWLRAQLSKYLYD